MILEFATAVALAKECAPTIAPATMLSIVQVESSFNPLAVNVNNAVDPRPPRNKEEAIRVAESLIRQGRNIDLGLAQINSKNLPWLGLSVADAFDPCRNLAAAARILENGYVSASRVAPQQQALRMAFSAYNTGSHSRGFRNGYVAKIEAAAGRVVPALGGVHAAAPPAMLQSEIQAALDAATENPSEPSQSEQAQPEAASWDVFARSSASTVHVFGR